MTVLGTVSDNSNWNELYLQAMDFLGGASTNLCRILQEKRRSTRNSVKCQEWRRGPFPLVLSQCQLSRQVANKRALERNMPTPSGNLIERTLSEIC